MSHALNAKVDATIWLFTGGLTVFTAAVWMRIRLEATGGMMGDFWPLAAVPLVIAPPLIRSGRRLAKPLLLLGFALIGAFVTALFVPAVAVVPAVRLRMDVLEYAAVLGGAIVGGLIAIWGTRGRRPGD